MRCIQFYLRISKKLTPDVKQLYSISKTLVMLKDFNKHVLKTIYNYIFA